MHLQQTIYRLKLRYFVIFFLFSLGSQVGFSQQPAVAPSQGAPATSSTPESEGKGPVAKPAVSVQPLLQRPIHIVPFREPGAVTTKLNLFPAGSHVDYFGGPVISSVHVVLVLYGPGAYLPNIAGTTTPTMANFYNDITRSTLFDMLSEYSTTGVRAVDGSAGTNQFIGHGFFDGQFSITPAAANNGATITDNQIQAELLSQVNAGNLPAPIIDAQGNNNTLYMIFFPQGKTITDGTSSSCVKGGFCAYHNSTNASFGTHRLFYGVMPDLQPPSLCSTGCGSGTTFDMATNVTSHELSEAVTDADVGAATSFGPPLAWMDQVNGEIGDICVAQEAQVLANGTTYTIQREFSNLQNDCVVAPPHYALSTNQTITAGSNFGLTLTLGDSNSPLTPVQGYTGTVHFSSSDPAAVLPADFTFLNVDGGTHDFIVNLKTAGQQTITVTDTQLPAFTGTASFTVNASVVSGFLIYSQANATTGAPATFVLNAVDGSNAFVSGYSGTVHFTSTDGTAVLPANTALTNSAGTFTAIFNTPGQHEINATDIANPKITGGQSVTVAAPSANPTITTVTATPNPSIYGARVPFVINVTGNGVSTTPAQLSLTVDNGQEALLQTSGNTTVFVSPSGGTHTVFANYSGDANRGASSSAPLTFTVNPASTPIVVSANGSSIVSGAQAQLSAGFNGLGSPRGTFTFFDGATPLGISPVGDASIAVTDLAVGTHSITAAYSGSVDILAATSAPITLTVTPPQAPDFSVSSTPASATLLAGQSVSLNLSINSLNGFFGSVKYSCANLPVLVTCSFSPATVTVTPTSPNANTVLTVKTTGPHAALVNPRSQHPVYAMLWPFGPFALGLVIMAGGKRKMRRLSGMCALLVLAMVVSISSCGGGGQQTQTLVPPPTATPAGTTTFVVTSTGTAITGANPANPSQQLSITLTVQP